MTEQYQDIWIKGALESKGVRECEQRYALIKKFCEKYKRPITVLDIGANLGYFTVRLAEDFPDACIVAIEGPTANELKAVLDRNECKNVVMLERTLTVADLKALAAVEHFDVVLALSVVTHFAGPSLADMVGVLAELGDHLIVELPVEPNACGQHYVAETQALLATLKDSDVALLGEGASHLSATLKRPILEIPRSKSKLAAAYLGSPRTLDMTIRSNFSRKEVSWGNKPEHRAWLPGINLHTYLRMGGVFPDRNKVMNHVGGGQAPHGDLTPWNFILAGDREVKAIDKGDPNVPAVQDDVRFSKRTLQALCRPWYRTAADFKAEFDQAFEATTWRVHPLYSVFTQFDQSYYLKQRDGFERKYRSMYALAFALGPTRIVELGTHAGSSADAYLSATRDIWSFNAVYVGYDLFAKGTREDGGGEWNPLDVANKLFADRGFVDTTLHTADLRSLKELPPADLVVVDAAHDFNNELADLELALTAWPEYIFVDDTNGQDARPALEEFLKRHADRVDWVCAIDYPDGGTVVRLR